MGRVVGQSPGVPVQPADRAPETPRADLSWPGEGSLPAETALPPRPDPIFDRIADVVRTVISVPVALVSLVDQNRQVFTGAAGLDEVWDARREMPLSHSFCQHVVRTGTPMVVSDAREHPVLKDNPAIRDLSVVAYAGVPLVDLDQRPIGSLCAIDTKPHSWTMAELALLDDLASACSTELQLRTAVARAAAAYERTRALLNLSEALSAAITVEDVAVTVAAAARDLLGAAFGGIAELDSGTGSLRYVSHDDVPGVITPSISELRLDSDTPSCHVIRSGEPLVVDLTELRKISPTTARLGEEVGGQTYAYFPLNSRGRTIGTLTLLWTDRRELSDEDADVGFGMARYAAQAVDRAQLLARQHLVASTLQAALLPELPQVPWLQVAGRYLPAFRTNEVGGDWYDAYLADEHTLVLTVGDVSGHDTEAAAAMGQLRAAARAITVDTPDTTAVLLTRLEHVMVSLAFERIVTAIAAKVTRTDDGVELTWSNAGHPPPLLLSPDQPPVYLDPPADPLLGLATSANPTRRNEHRMLLPVGSTLLLFTDGLIERRSRHLDDGLQWLADFASDRRDLPPAELVRAVIGSTAHTDQFDDTVLLALRVPA